MKLSVEQQLAAYTDEDKVLVCSAAGAGKTTCLTERVRFLLCEKNVDPNELYCITFTNMAAEEMKQRIGDKTKGAFIGTIHSLANYILLSNGLDTSAAIKEEEFDKFFEMLYDNSDIIKIPKVSHLLVDEFQDISENEYDFITNVLKPDNFWYVGDSRQAIYSFKGSNFKYFMQLTMDPFVCVYELDDCYRCGPEIVHFANRQIAMLNDIYFTPIHCIKPVNSSMVEEYEYSHEQVLDILDTISDTAATAILCRTNRMVDDILKLLNDNGYNAVTFKKSEKTLEELKEEMSSDKIKVLTIHSAKGLEWNNVIVIQEFKPFNNEECRINYVAATRAKTKLYWLKPIKKKKRRRTSIATMQEWG